MFDIKNNTLYQLINDYEITMHAVFYNNNNNIFFCNNRIYIILTKI